MSKYTYYIFLYVAIRVLCRGNLSGTRCPRCSLQRWARQKELGVYSKMGTREGQLLILSLSLFVWRIEASLRSLIREQPAENYKRRPTNVKSKSGEGREGWRSFPGQLCPDLSHSIDSLQNSRVILSKGAPGENKGS